MNVKFVSIVCALVVALAVLGLHPSVSAQQEELKLTISAPPVAEKSHPYLIAATLTNASGAPIGGQNVEIWEGTYTPEKVFQSAKLEAHDNGDGTYWAVGNSTISQTYEYFAQCQPGQDASWIVSNQAFVRVGTPPIANAGEDQTVGPGGSVLLDGRGSSDPEGQTPLSYWWALQTNGSGSFEGSQTAETVGFAPGHGTSVIWLSVWNAAKAWSGWDEVRVTSNAPPVAQISDVHSVDVGGNVTLSGAPSSDPDNDPLTYTWTLSSVPPGSTATITPDPATPADASFHADKPGTYVVQLIVNDGYVDSAASTATVTANVVPPTGSQDVPQTIPAAPEGTTQEATFAVTYPGSQLGLTLTSPTGTVLDGTTTLPANVKYWDEKGSIGYTVTNPTPGQWTMHITAIDVPPTGEPYAVSTSVTATTSAPNDPPALQPLSVPLSPVRLASTVTATASFTDPTAGDRHTVTWDWGDGSPPTTSLVTTEPSGTTPGTASGAHAYTIATTYTITCTVTDAAGGTATQHASVKVISAQSVAGEVRAMAAGLKDGDFDKPQNHKAYVNKLTALATTIGAGTYADAQAKIANDLMKRNAQWGTDPGALNAKLGTIVAELNVLQQG